MSRQTLCNVCANLNISVDDFLGQSRGPRLQEGGNVFGRSLGSLVEIWNRPSCPLCRLVTAATRNSAEKLIESLPTELRWSVRCRLEWNKDGRRTKQSVREDRGSSSATRRLRIFDPEGRFPDAYLVLLADKDRGDTTSWSLGRIITSPQIDLQQVRNWIRECSQTHGERCNASNGKDFEDLAKMRNFRAINVQTMAIVESPGESFVALSYIWGHEPNITLTQSNYELLTSIGGLHIVLEEIPQTIRDAIHLTRKLGQTFLWVDSLCIIQDSSEDKIANISTMDLVYGTAMFTICVASGNARSGIPGMPREPRSIEQHIETYSPGVRLLLTRPAEHYIARSMWNNRAWTFQERMCSKRCLIFVDGKVYFQCQQTTMSEEIHSETRAFHAATSGWSLELRDAPMRIFMENPLRQYTTCVKLYTSRKLSYLRDKLHAFQGIEKLLSVSLNSDFLWGLPCSYFDFALLWEPVSPLRRHSGSEFPSWSWCGWEDGVEFRHSTLAGVLSDMHGWLAKRTWIVWYTRGSNGSLVPVWDGKKSGIAGRWAGYSKMLSAMTTKHPSSTNPSASKAPSSKKYLPNSLSTRLSRIRESISDNRRNWQGDPQEEGADAYAHLEFTRKRTKSLEVLPQQLASKQRVSADHLETCPLLYFWTYSSFFALAPDFKSDSAFASGLELGLQRYSLADKSGDWCGTIVLSEDWASFELGKAHEFIAISEAHDFSMEEHDTWTYYVPRDRVDSEWEIYYVLLIVTDEDGISERKGLGKVYKEAFENSFEPGSAWREFALG